MPEKLKHRVIIDTNLWISYLLRSEYSKIDTILSDDRITLLFSSELIEEFIEVANRPKFKKYFSSSDIDDLFAAISTKADFILTTSSIDICRDPKDNFLLALAKDSRATHLLSGDKDLLALKKFGNTEIITTTEYFAKNNM